jgi:hypothetical protein
LGTPDDDDGELDGLDELLLQAARTRAALAATAVSAIIRFALKSNETTSFYRTAYHVRIIGFRNPCQAQRSSAPELRHGPSPEP